VLVVDDVFDTGKTAAAVKGKMDAIGTDMRMACVYWKPEKNATEMKPDYYVRDVGGSWIVFPHEVEGLSTDEVAKKDLSLAQLIASCQE
jgi:hypoxanthine phosphoribosyltransferase